MRLAVIPGDGIGPEVIGEALKVLNEVAPDAAGPLMLMLSPLMSTALTVVVAADSATEALTKTLSVAAAVANDL